MRTTSIAIAALALLLTFGCKDQSTTAPASNNEATVAQQTNLSPEDLGRLGAEIRKHPHDAQKLLSEHGLTEKAFEQAIRKVAEDPAASKRYAEAYKKPKA